MSALNLVPSPSIIAAQAAIFLANMWVVKRYILTPYLELAMKRVALTTGLEAKAKEDHKKLLAESERLASQIALSHQGAKKEKEKLLSTGKDGHKKILEEAKEKAQKLTNEAKSQTEVLLKSDKAKMDPLCAELTRVTLARLLA